MPIVRSEVDARALDAKFSLATVMDDLGELPEARAMYEAVLEAQTTS